QFGGRSAALLRRAGGGVAVAWWEGRAPGAPRPAPAGPAPCRSISNRTGRSADRSELTFLVSVLVPQAPEPRGASEVFTSQRSEPSSIRTSETSSARSRYRSSVT